MPRKKIPYLMILPYFLLYIAFGLFPILFSLGVSFTSWDGIGDVIFIGLANYKRVFTQDKFFYKSLWNTIILLVISTPIQIILGLLMATFLKDFFKRTRNGLQLINFLPYITTPVAVGIIFQLMFDWKSGIINALLNLFGVESIYWLGNAWPSRIVVILMIVWKNYGYMMIMFLSGLSSIPDELYEAARIDGAKWWGCFTKITIPLLRPIFVFVITTSVINGFKLFDEPQLLFSSASQPIGGPDRAVMTVVMRFYEASFRSFEFGYGSALAYCLFLVIAGASLVLFRLVGGRKEK
ncbi:sugar ABC transporter permease [Eisenbergiella tayi]|uniref:L-arabinose transport system permease protein AraP n=2 Tax=Eisenbergiella tayi TaxID=1432052 RepID=A0A1E3AN68_9FIRM|nr:sugar ABC transporter permease [Eisenbergiella tayi]ODM10138.1 L-arabinose transport system permease protein AraP [Eisenbergiella tayi]ODR33410.1 sugar ABC transporter permease [Eisenbergiella tayi]ODR35766.1 sugar ABC transporter permease [Eisenbergiella tayi]OIZ61535.1 sugar ABC transporter permease [Eisenbergiella tayi]